MSALMNNIDAFYALSDPSRREILRLLSEDKKSINSIAKNFDISRPAVSKHIKVLTQTGFITIEELGRERYCILNQQGFYELEQWLGYFENYWTKRLKNLETFLAKNK